MPTKNKTKLKGIIELSNNIELVSSISDLIDYSSFLRTEEAAELLKKAEKISADTFLSLSSWAKETNNFAPHVRGIIGGSASRMTKGFKPSGKQAVQVIKAIREAKELGFKFD